MVQSSIPTQVKQRGDSYRRKLKGFEIAPRRSRPFQEAQDFTINGWAFMRTGVPESGPLTG